jgi:hypothetical protein
VGDDGFTVIQSEDDEPELTESAKVASRREKELARLATTLDGATTSTPVPPSRNRIRPVTSDLATVDSAAPSSIVSCDHSSSSFTFQSYFALSSSESRFQGEARRK